MAPLVLPRAAFSVGAARRRAPRDDAFARFVVVCGIRPALLFSLCRVPHSPTPDPLNEG
jgi:hypothetical protein